MKPITEQRRQEIIADCEKEIEHAKKILSSASLAPGWRKVHEKNLWKNEIALASLTAQPVGYTWDRGINCEIPAADLNDDAPLGVNLYAAQPVTAFDLPGEIEGVEHTEYGAGKNDGWNLCLDEIKRRNGLGE